MEEYGSMGFPEEPKYIDGFGFRLFYAIVMVLNVVWSFVLFLMGMISRSNPLVEAVPFGFICIVALLLSVLGFIAAIKGRTCMWANTVSIVIGVITCVALLGVFAIIGGVKGKKAIRIREHEIVGLYNEKEVTRYSAHRYSVKLLQIVAVSYFVMPVLFVLAPLFALGLGKCRKRFIVFAVFFSVGLVLFGVFFGLFLTTLGNMKETFHGINISFLYCIFWSVGAALLGIFWLCSFIGLCTYVHNHQYIASVEQDTKKLKGKIGLAEFRKALVEKSKARDVDGFIGVLAAASEEYEARKDHIIDVATFRERLAVAVATVATVDGSERAKEFKTQCRGLFESHEFEMLDALFESATTRFEECEETSGANVNTQMLRSDETSPSAEHIKPKASPRVQKGIMIAISVLYGLLLLGGILLASIPDLSGVLSGMGICEEINARAYGISIGVMFVALSPSIGYYFAVLAPVELNKKAKIILFAASAGLCAIMTSVFFIIINFATVEIIVPIPVKEFFETSDVWFMPVSMVFAELGLAICYVLLLFKLQPDKIKDFKPQKTGDGFAASIKYYFMCFCATMLKGLKAMLKFKERYPEIFVLTATVLLTWLAFFTSFIFSIVMIAMLVTVIIMMFVGLIEYCYIPSKPYRKAIAKNEYGQEIELEENPYTGIYTDRLGKQYEYDPIHEKFIPKD